MRRKLTIHLASGGSIPTEELYGEDLDDFEVLEEIQETLTKDARPGWRCLGNVLVFSQAVSAVELD